MLRCRQLRASAPLRENPAAPHSAFRTPHWPRGFTLMELLIVIGIIAILAALAAVGMVGAINQARAARTRSQINKIDILITEKYESYRTRAVRVPPSSNAIISAGNRLSALRELMRLEMPDQIADICTDAELTDVGSDGALDAFTSLTDAKRAVLSIVPSVTCSYKRLAFRNSVAQGKSWSTANQSAECLYLILSTMKDGDKSAIEFFTPDEIGDVDEDGMKEILDGFGRPIFFFRWAPGYSQMPGPDGQWGVAGSDDDGNGTTDDVFEAGWPTSDDITPPTLQTRIAWKHPTNLNIEAAPDPFDPLKVDPRWTTANPPFGLKPLIFSPGPDEISDITAVPAHVHATPSMGHPANDPYYLGASAVPGTPFDGNGDGVISADNITNHFIEPQ